MSLEQRTRRHTGLTFRQAGVFPVGRIEEVDGDDPQIGVAVVEAVLDILEEMTDHGDRDHVADVLRGLDPLKDDPDDLPIPQGRAPGVARVDGGVDLNHQVIITGGMGIKGVIDPGDHPAGDRDPPSPGREAVGLDQRAERGDLAVKIEVGSVGKEFRVEDFDQGQVAVVPDMGNHRPVRGAAVLLLNLQIAGVADHVGTGQDPVAGDDHPGTAADGKILLQPGRGVIRPLADILDLDNRLPDPGDLGLLHRRNRKGREQGRPAKQ